MEIRVGLSGNVRIDGWRGGHRAQETMLAGRCCLLRALMEAPPQIVFPTGHVEELHDARAVAESNAQLGLAGSTACKTNLPFCKLTTASGNSVHMVNEFLKCCRTIDWHRRGDIKLWVCCPPSRVIDTMRYETNWLTVWHLISVPRMSSYL